VGVGLGRAAGLAVAGGKAGLDVAGLLEGVLGVGAVLGCAFEDVGGGGVADFGRVFKLLRGILLRLAAAAAGGEREEGESGEGEGGLHGKGFPRGFRLPQRSGGEAVSLWTDAGS